MKTIRYGIFALLMTAIVCPGASADETIWKSGRNLYITLTDQGTAAPPNQQPINLDPRELTNALQTITVWEKHFFMPNEQSTLFSVEQARVLGQFLAAGLAKATPQQDIVFALARKRKGFLSIQNVTYMAGRAFYANNRLNIIIGDWERKEDKFEERVQASTGNTEMKYYFTVGSRTRESDFNAGVITGAGISIYEQGGRSRQDWVLVDVHQASQTWLAEQGAEQKSGDTADSAALQAEAARLAQERRELRLEMARFKKEMSSGAAGGTAQMSVEDRLKNLEELHKKQLITDEEYAAKRKEILNDI